MAVVVQMSDLIATWDGSQWSGKDAAFVALLNECRRFASSYLPHEVNARRMMQRAVGDSGWSVIRSDPQPTEPGTVY